MTDILKLTTGQVYLVSGTGIFTQSQDGLATTSTDGLVLVNNTAATAGVPVQQSPRLRFRSNVWNTTAVAANNTDDFFIESVPVSGLVPSGLLKFGSSLNGAAATYPFSLRSDGRISIADGLLLTGGTAGYVQWSGIFKLTVPAINQLNFQNTSGTGGFGLDTSTAAIAKFRTLAQTGYATVDALGYRINGGAGAVDSTDEIEKSLATIANAVATTLFTITVPNAAHSATILIEEVGSLGAGGAIGANEASAANSYYITVARTAGVNAVAAISAAFGTAAAAVAGAATATSVITVGAVAGAVGATNTFPVQITITRSGGLSDNHTCMAVAKVLNANATGITIA